MNKIENNLAETGIDKSLEATKAEIERAKSLGFTFPARTLRLKATGQEGKFAGLNETTGGPRPGSQFPIIVNIDGKLIEYPIDDLEFVNDTATE